MSPPYLAPGVYVEEVPSAVRPIAGVGTSIAALHRRGRRHQRPVEPQTSAGHAGEPKGEAYVQACRWTAQPINSWTEFTQAFGDLQAANQYLAHAVYGFTGGGARAEIVAFALGN